MQKENPTKKIFKDLFDIVANNYLVEPKDKDIQTYLDLTCRCLVCNKELKMHDVSVREDCPGCFSINGFLEGGEKITFDDGLSAYLCHECITGGKQCIGL